MKLVKKIKYIPIIELVLMGGGHTTPFFTRIASIFFLLITWLTKTASYKLWSTILLLILLLIYYGIKGIYVNNNIELIIQDIKSYAFVLLIPALISFYSDEESKNKIIEIIKKYGTIVSFIHISLILMLLIENPYAIQYARYLEENDELRFRLFPALVIKANIFGALAIIVIIATLEKIDFKLIMILSINIISIILTLTRGFYISVIITLAYILLMTIEIRKRFILIILLPLMGYITFSELLGLEIFNERNVSDGDRMGQIESVINLNIGIIKTLIGQGFGTLINNSVKSEIFILETFTKFGLIGTLIFIFYALTHIIKNVVWPSSDSKVRAYAAIVLLLIIQSLTNSYITNNIGGILIIIAFIHLPNITSKINRKKIN